MKYALLIAVLLFASAAPALAQGNVATKSRAAQAQAEKAALAELISARLKAALQGEAYVLDKTCDAQADCTISIRP